MKIKTNKELKDYYEGKGCKCAASCYSECGCEEADWTPKEVYKLRLKLKEANEYIKELEEEIVLVEG